MKRILLPFLLALAWALAVPQGVSAAGAPVVAAICAGSGPACTIVIVSTSNLLLACGSNFAGETVAIVADTKSATWTQVTANQHLATPGADLHCWTATPPSTGSDVITISNQFGDAGFGAVAEISGIAASSFVDTSNQAGGTSGVMSSGNFTTTAIDFVVGFGTDGTGAGPALGAGFTTMGAPTCTCLADARILFEYKASVAGSTAIAATSTSTQTSWIIQGFGLKEAGGAGATVPKRGLLGVGQ